MGFLVQKVGRHYHHIKHDGTGSYHCEDGYAFVVCNEDNDIIYQLYFINGKHMEEEEFLVYTRKRKLGKL
jgi:hypothetical protein